MSKELFEQSEDAYFQATVDLTKQAASGELAPIPQSAKDESLALIDRMAGKMLRKYGDSLAEAVGTAYRFATAETWEGLDRGRAKALIDSGLERVRQQHIETGEAEPLVVADPEHRMHYTLLGLTGEHPAFEDLRAYVFAQPAYERLSSLDDLHLKIGFAAGGIKGRHADEFIRAQWLAWEVGRNLGILDVLGEVPN